jgi:hypothetical protein
MSNQEFEKFDAALTKALMTVSILKPKIISRGLSVCRTNDGQVVISAHEDKQRILLEVSERECISFAEKLLDLFKKKKQVNALNT